MSRFLHNMFKEPLPALSNNTEMLYNYAKFQRGWFMESTVNLTAIYIANFLGLLTLLLMLFPSCWKLKENNEEARLLKVCIFIGILGCLADPLAFSADGKPGLFARILVYLGNSLFYMANVTICYIWVKMICLHTLGKMPKLHAKILGIIVHILYLGLFINLFVPCVYIVDAENIYHRSWGTVIYTTVMLSLLLDGIIVYLVAHKKGGILTFFPVLGFTIPMGIGFTLQILFYGISTIWPTAAISICGMFLGLQSELVFKDNLTGIYNRFYLDCLKARAAKAKETRFYVIMIDMNGFKTINDNFGHLEGDFALKTMASLLSTAVGTLGNVIRYAGDEFIIILNTQDKSIVDATIASINSLIEDYNANSGKEYKLSLSMGVESVDLSAEGVDMLLNKVDDRMYEAKEEYYKENDRRR